MISENYQKSLQKESFDVLKYGFGAKSKAIYTIYNQAVSEPDDFQIKIHHNKD